MKFAHYFMRRKIMLNLEHGIDSMTNFKRQTAEYLERLHKTGEPVVLTVNGKAQVVVQDAGAYQKLLDAAAKADREEDVAAIREGLADVSAGRTKAARAALKALAKKYGIGESGH
jgi:prevent-host-death family protein